MAKRARRYEFYLPIDYNPDEQGTRRPIEESKFLDIEQRLHSQFGGKTASPDEYPYVGSWLDVKSQKRFEDRIRFLLVFDSSEDWLSGELFVRDLKEEMKILLDQLEIMAVGQDVLLF